MLSADRNKGHTQITGENTENEALLSLDDKLTFRNADSTQTQQDFQLLKM